MMTATELYNELVSMVDNSDIDSNEKIELIDTINEIALKYDNE